jgi:hypothetical protein
VGSVEQEQPQHAHWPVVLAQQGLKVCDDTFCGSMCNQNCVISTHNCNSALSHVGLMLACGSPDEFSHPLS